MNEALYPVLPLAQKWCTST